MPNASALAKRPTNQEALPPRTRKIRVKASGKSRGEHQKEGILGAGLALGALKLVATMLKPTITRYVAKKMSGYAAGARRV
jgi:hypothetical protein